MNRLLDTVLNDRFIDDGQHFFRLRLGGGQKAGTESRGGENCFTDFSRHKLQFGAAESLWQPINCFSHSAVLCIGTWEKNANGIRNR
jgi:hypothetical protein